MEIQSAKKIKFYEVLKYPITFLILLLSLLLCIPSYIYFAYAKFWSVGSNIAYLVPFVISIQLKKYTFAMLFLMIVLISSFYHVCATYDVCIYPLEESMAIDVLFSWLLMLTLVSYVAYKKYYQYLIVVNFAIVLLSHEAHCPIRTLGYDCEFVKMGVVGLYVVLVFVQHMRNHEKQMEIDWTDLIVALACFGIAFFFYLTYQNENLQHHYANHSIWHTMGAAAGALILTVYRDSKIHLWGWKNEGSDEEKEMLVTRKDIIY